MTMNTACVTAGFGWPLPSTQNRYLYRFRPNSKSEKVDGRVATAPHDDTSAETREAIVCRQCLHGITASAERTLVNGAHTHTFANPEGIVFEIGCYREAWGCGYLGPASPEFTWFAGYVWRIAVCSNCLTHLGWRFSSPDGHVFHGLITSRLTATG
jgi:hypothetical protein